MRVLHGFRLLSQLNLEDLALGVLYIFHLRPSWHQLYPPVILLVGFFHLASKPFLLLIWQKPELYCPGTMMNHLLQLLLLIVKKVWDLCKVIVIASKLLETAPDAQSRA